MALQTEIEYFGNVTCIECPSLETISWLKTRYADELTLTNAKIKFYTHLKDPSTKIPNRTMLCTLPIEQNVLKLYAIIKSSIFTRIEININFRDGQSKFMKVHPEMTLYELRNDIFTDYDLARFYVEFKIFDGKEIENLSKRIIHLLLEQKKVELEVCLINLSRDFEYHHIYEAHDSVVDRFADDCEIASSSIGKSLPKIDENDISNTLDISQFME